MRLLVALLCLFVGLSVAAPKKTEAQIREQKNALKKLESDLAKKREELVLLETEEKGVINTISLLDQNLNQTRIYINELSKNESLVQRAVEQLQHDIDSLDQKIHVRREAMKVRIRKLYVSGVSHSALELWYGAYGLDRERLIVGRKDGSAMHFTGLLDASAVGTPVTFDFTILDQENKIAYTRSVGPKTVNGNLSVDLGDISDESKWKATPYEDMGIDNADGKRMYWARRNLGATSDSGINCI